MTRSAIRKTLHMTGIVQGVGFRPALHNLCVARGLGGLVQNRTGSVRLVLEGCPVRIDSFLAELPGLLPAQARIDSVSAVSQENLTGPVRPFAILPSERGFGTDVVIPPDLALCDSCAAEILDPQDRRYGYPFTTCIHCGPRYTVVHATPYDRERTTLSVFPLCPDCESEYRSPDNRRFHAESTACPACGPTLNLFDPRGRPLPGPPLQTARRRLAQGDIAAVRGLGGYLLAADAFNAGTLARLRERKNRPDKPFAVMARSLAVLRRYARIEPGEESLLHSAQAPIVILDRASDAGAFPVALISPDTETVGAMLPTTALHKLLFEPVGDDPVPPFDLLVMTSGNRGGEPICISDKEAFERLASIADFFLSHNREINLRNDDSVAVARNGEPQLWRRARGYAPTPVRLASPVRRVVLALGADLKNTVALAYDDKVALSPHVGDLETPEAVSSIEETAEKLPRFLNRRPEAVAVDGHPDMHSTFLGHALAEHYRIPVVPVQHHVAHAAACLAEHGLDRGLALVFDGTGLGTDGTIWGAELFELAELSAKRLATFKSVPLPGGDAAVRIPVRQLAGRWHAAGINPSARLLRKLGVSPEEAEIWRRQCERGINAPETHAAGRLFDAWSALLGFAPPVITYEGQAAVRLEAAAGKGRALHSLPCQPAEEDGLLQIDWSESFQMLSAERYAQSRDPDMAMSAHWAIAKAAWVMIDYGLSRSREQAVALSGGVFMNRIVTQLLFEQLKGKRVRVLIHSRVPPNDGCIALGQAVFAGRQPAFD